MGSKLSSRQQLQLGFLDAQEPRLPRLYSLIEKLSSPSEAESVARTLARSFDDIKANATMAGLPKLADAAAGLAMTARRGVSPQVKLRALREGFVMLKHHFDASRKAATTPESGSEG